jgi:hypothetical protein
MNNRTKTILSACAVAFFVFAWWGTNYYLSLRTVVVNYENINSVSIFSGEKITDRDGQKPLKTITRPGQEIKLRKGSYVLQYDAADNYRDYFVNINLKDKRQAVSISPDYSDKYLNELLDGQISSIKESIEAKYPKVRKLYDIQRGRLYKKADWYGTTLVYKGSATGADLFKTDTLRVVLKKENSGWMVKTNPPNILLSKYVFPDIPEDILRNVNSLSSSPGG